MTLGELFLICIGVAVVYVASLLINLIVKDENE